MKSPQARAKALERAGISGRTVRVLKQVHGAEIQEARFDDASVPEADGWLVVDPRVAAGVYAADCLPIFVWENRGRAAGVFHAGWRGLAAGMPKAAVRAFEQRGFSRAQLSACVGPHIGACCYEVGEDVASKFHREAVRPGDKPRLDLGEEARLQLAEAGLSADAIAISDACTRCRADEFFSFRREKMDQRMMAFIALPESAAR